MKKALPLILFIVSFAAILNAQNDDGPFIEMLDLLEITESDLGFVPRGYWARYPVSQDIPYKIISFDDLMAEPHRMYDFVQIMALSAQENLHPENQSSSRLLKVAFYCGVQHLTSQLRAYNASLFDNVKENEPLLHVIEDTYAATGREFVFHRFGEAADFPLLKKNYREAIKGIHPDIEKLVAKTTCHLLSAYKFREIALRSIDYKQALKTWKIRLLGETQFDGMEYYPELEDCAAAIDMNSIYYAGYKLLESSVWLADTLKKLKAERSDIDWEAQNLNISTPIGRIVISGSGSQTHNYNDAILVLDLGGDDIYNGAAGSTASLDNGVSLYIDLEGDDLYDNTDEFAPSQGAAIFGAAMLLDMEGDDTYISKRLSQGAAMLGFGILADMDGDDSYQLQTSGQGAAYFGIGLAIDNKGDDKYFIWGDGQGYGGVGGAGALINRTGNDIYKAEINPANVYRPDMDHSKDGEHNYTYCQGSGAGRRGDITDGHSWAGGIGVILDLAGDDIYESGNWSQACGYWYGMGFLYDGSGDDKYKSTSWSMACGAHFCLSAFIDEGGNDEHEIWHEQGVGMAFGHDYTATLFLNKGGDDTYRLKKDGLGFAINMSQVFFFDTEGDDKYTRGGGNNYGWNNYEKNNPPYLESSFHLYSSQICLFGDLAGVDEYIQEDFFTGATSPDSIMGDNFEVYCPNVKERENIENQNYYGLGKDWESSSRVEYFRNKLKKRRKTME